jgi:hypothetical protein
LKIESIRKKKKKRRKSIIQNIWRDHLDRAVPVSIKNQFEVYSNKEVTCLISEPTAEYDNYNKKY